MPTTLTPVQVHRRGPVRRLLVAHPWVGGAALTASLALLTAVSAQYALGTVRGMTFYGMYLPASDTSRDVMVAWLLGAAAGTLLLVALRRRHPIGVAAALTVLAVVTLVASGVLGILGVCLGCAVFAVASAHPPRTTWLVLVAVLVLVSLAIWRWQEIGLAETLLWPTAPMVEGRVEDYVPARQLVEPPFSSGRRTISIVLLLVLLLLGVAIGSGVRARRIHALNLVERYESMARDRDASAALARASERARIAREVHDIVAHSVSVMVALSDGAGAALDRAPDRSREALLELSRTGRDALSDMKHVLGALDPGAEGADDPPGRSEPTATALPMVVERFRTAGLPVTASGLDVPLPPDTSLRLAVVRVVTEALTNVLRHAPGARSVEVVVRRTGSQVEVEVVDSGGRRPVSDVGTGRGVAGMRERVTLLGGRIDVGPRPGGGWRVHVVLPCDGYDDDFDGGGEA